MSLVSVLASTNIISFVSDGREIDTEKHLITSENFKKINKVNSKIIFSITGNSGASKIINENLHIFCQDNAKAFAHSMFDQLGNNCLERVVMFLIGGVDEKGSIYFAGFQNDSTDIIEITPVLQNINQATASSETAQEINPNELLNNYVISGIKGVSFLTPKIALDIQTKFNNKISEMDESVNRTIFHEFICKDINS